MSEQAPTAENDAHRTSVRFSRAWDEYVPDCSCGWVGSYVNSEARAMAQAAEHRDKIRVTSPCRQGHDRSAGRWCSECDQHGSHHSDKHWEFTCCTPPGEGRA